MTVEIKFNVKDLVWYMENNKPKNETIWNINISIGLSGDGYIKYVFYRSGANQNPVYKEEIECFATKEELLKSL